MMSDFSVSCLELAKSRGLIRHCPLKSSKLRSERNTGN